jgi:hypothetical protein
MLPLRQMSRYLSVTQKWLKGEAKAGRVPHVLADGRYLFPPDAVEMALADKAAQEFEASSQTRSCGQHDASEGCAAVS